jgi:CDP-4-dehydro-6-deoxyglucose reductase, E3
MDGFPKEMLAGLDRDQLHWNPTIDKNICSNCQVCYNFCKHHVYDIIEEQVLVQNPTECVVLCNHCEPLCPNGAIKFPTQREFLKEVRDLRRQLK